MFFFFFLKKLKESVEMETKLQKTYPTNYSLLIRQDMWKALYQISSEALQKKLIKLNVNMDMMIKKCTEKCMWN